MSTVIGRQAEDAATEFLKNCGFAIVQQNWRTRWCEIDIVALKNGIVYFAEVKYRSSQNWGSGLDYITPKKLKQMYFAAEFWCAKSTGATDFRLSAIEATGRPPRVIGFIESIEL